MSLFALTAALLAIPAPERVAFHGVNVVPMDSERVLLDQTVLIEDGFIRAIGPASEMPVPIDARVIECEGQYLMPGLADMHVHCFSPFDHLLFIANGVTTVRNMWGWSSHLKWREQADAREEDFLAPTFYTAGPLLDGDPPVWPTSTKLTDPEEARAEVVRQVESGYHFIKAYSRLLTPVYEAIIDEAARLGIPVVGHVPADVGLDGVLEARQSTIEHLDGYVSMSGETPDPEKLARWIEATLEAGTWNCPTLVVLKNISELDHYEELEAAPEMRYVSGLVRSSWNPSNDFRFKDAGPERYAAMKRRFEHGKEVTRAMHEAGCPLLLGTDTPNPYVVAGFSIHAELALFVDSGLTPYEALRAGSSGAAEHLDAAGEWGVVAQGARADLVLLNANPLEDVANFRSRAGVMLRGRWYSEEDLQRRLEELADYFAPAGADEER